MHVLVTGAKGFIGRNLVVALHRRGGIDVQEYDLDSAPESLEKGVASAEVIFHLAGVNRPQKTEEFVQGNVDSTKHLCEVLRRLGRKPTLIYSSSTQAVLDNPYGQSKRKAEDIILTFGAGTAAKVAVFRLPGVFGKWCRPNYNSVVATFCHNVAHGLPLEIKDPAKELDLVHIDGVVAAFLGILNAQGRVGTDGYYLVEPVFKITLNRLAQMIQGFHASRKSLIVPDFSDHFARCLYSTYISYLPTAQFSYPLEQREDARGSLAEVLKSPNFGQIFVSRTRPGVMRGNHYHDTKVEKFAVLEGDAVIRFRHILGEDIIEYPVSGREFRVVDIPPGYTHSIENIGQSDLIVLFWAYEELNPADSDTYPLNVKKEK
ncbi:MAG: NAD-dependent epimerase/dehydratase family protein [Candidatus Aminicenantales bacterium]